MRRLARACAPLLALLGAVACGDFFDVGCQADQRPGIEVTVRDSITGGSVPGLVTAAATSGTFADTVEAPGDESPFLLADGRPGTYEVEVTAAEYRPWSRTGVLVPESTSGCVVRRIPLSAWLQPEAGS